MNNNFIIQKAIHFRNNSDLQRMVSKIDKTIADTTYFTERIKLANVLHTKLSIPLEIQAFNELRNLVTKYEQ